MLSAGMTTPAQLARRCGVSRKTAADWLAMERATLSAERLALISKRLNVRLLWFFEDVPGMDRKSVQEVMAVADALTPEQCAEWLEIGRHMAKKK